MLKRRCPLLPQRLTKRGTDIVGVAIDRATISIDGAHVASQNSKGVIAVARADQEIMVEDLMRVEEAATAIQLPPNREIIQVFPRSYSVDGQENDWRSGWHARVRLEVESHIITGSVPAIKNLDRSIHQAGIEIQGQILVPLAAARAVLTKKQMELGVALIDIGGGTTGVAVYEEGDILYSSVVPVGAGPHYQRFGDRAENQCRYRGEDQAQVCTCAYCQGQPGGAGAD